MARGILRVSVREVTVSANGDVPEDKNPEARSAEKNNAIVANLRYPRSGAPSVVSSLAVNLESGGTTRFDVDDFWRSGLFKEEVDGETVLSIQILDRDLTSRFAKVVAALAGTILTAGLGGVVGGISNAIVGAVASLPVNALGASFQLDDETMTVLGEAQKELKVGEIPGELILTLVAPGTVTKDYWAPERPGDTQLIKKQKILVRQGDALGTIALAIGWEPL